MIRSIAVLAIALGSFLAMPAAGAQNEATVNAVLFFSPTCGHCEYVINETLPPLYVEHGGPWEVYYDDTLPDSEVAFYILGNGTLEFLLVDVSVAPGAELFMAATERYDIPSNGVPRLVIDDQWYIGSGDIPAELPGIVAEGTAGEGIGWPDIPGIDDALAAVPASAVVTTSTTSTTTTAPGSTTTAGSSTSSSSTSTTTTTTSGSDTTTTTEAGGVFPVGGDGESVAERFGRDPVGNSISVVVLAGMLASLAALVVVARRPGGNRSLGIAVPIIAVLGMVVAAYLTYVETADAEAVCGPVGDCNTVQQSEYAELFGVIPIGLLGLVGYAVVLVTWLVARAEHNPISDWARVALLAGTVAGVAFSIYLTFLEPFVIGATCAWCLTSAVVITVLMLLAAGPGVDSLRRLRSIHELSN